MNSPIGWRSCKSKKRFRHRQDAARARTGCERRRGWRLRIYECSLCKGFHLTHKEEKAVEVVA